MTSDAADAVLLVLDVKNWYRRNKKSSSLKSLVANPGLPYIISFKGSTPSI
jgi:hypothetical protein